MSNNEIQLDTQRKLTGNSVRLGKEALDRFVVTHRTLTFTILTRKIALQHRREARLELGRPKQRLHVSKS
jgi:hypothetical protein